MLASDQDLARNLALNSLEYERVCLLLQRHFPIIVTDGATGPALPATLSAGPRRRRGRLAHRGRGRCGPSKTLDWLVAHGYRERPPARCWSLDGDRASDDVDAARLRAHFACPVPGGRGAAARPAPGPGRPDRRRGPRSGTREAALELAALVADEFGMVTAGRR